jgi:SAM-dependent methyltransferase
VYVWPVGVGECAQGSDGKGERSSRERTGQRVRWISLQGAGSGAGQEAAAAWARWTPTLQAWLAPVDTVLLELAGIGLGQRVLDVAAGAGEPAVSIAPRVGPTGSVLATDLSPAILALADAHARQGGIANLETRVMDGEALELADASVDAVVSRLGVIYFPDRVGALREMRRVLRPGGRAAIVGITNPAANPFSAITGRLLATRANLPPPPTGGPGPFSMGDPALMQAAFEEAGFDDISTRIVDAPLHLSSAKACVQFLREAFAGLDAMLLRLSPADRQAAWDDVAEALRAFEHDGAFTSPAQFIVGAGRA